MNCHSGWVDIVCGEPVSTGQLIDDLLGVDVVYLGERHTIKRHHDLQQMIIDQLGGHDRKLVLCLEQVERFNQPALDSYADGEITISQLADQMDWKGRWSNCEDYFPLLETVRRHGGRILALNARAEIVRQVARRGLESLDQSQRAELPAQMRFDDLPYAAHLHQAMSSMAAAMPHRMKTMIHAQIVRDETMADSIFEFLSRPQNIDYRAVVICGSGHINYGFGTAERLRRRMPHLKDRIIVMSNSGELKMSDSVKAMSKDVELNRDKLGEVPRRIADYLHIVMTDGD